MNAKEMEQKMGIPKDIGSYIFDTYAQTISAKSGSANKFHYSRNKKMQDKLICHIIVLMLIIRDYQLDVKWLINALKLDLPKLSSYLRLASCFPEKKKKIAVDGEEEPTEGKGDWSLNKSGSLMVYLKAPMRLQNKGKKRAKR